MSSTDLIMGSAGSSTAALPDPNFKNVSLLLSGDGTNGSQNNTFLDSSTNNFTITRNGNTTQGSFSPYSSNWGNYFNGSSRLTGPTNNSAFNLSSGDFTVEAWIFKTADGGICSYGDGDEVDFDGWVFTVGVFNAGQLNFAGYINGNGTRVASANGAISNNVWTHVAAVKSGSTITLYINGTSVNTSTSVSIGNNTSCFLTVGAWSYPSEYRYITGSVSNLRIVKAAVYTSNFTPSTTPLTAIANTSLLTCQSNRFRDASSNNFTLTVNGTPSVQRFSPFNPTAPYDTATIGGSGYFDGSGDYLSIAQTLWSSNGNATFETWVYVTSLSNQKAIFNTSGQGDFCINTNGTIRVHPADSNFKDTSGTVPLNSWTHIALVQTASNRDIFINGVLQTYSSTTGSPNTVAWNNPTGTMNIGQAGTYRNDLVGYFANVRVTNTQVYSSTFTPPTAPVTAISGTQLLANMTNAGIPDLAMQNDLQTVGNAQVSTSVKKYGTGSLKFNGTTDYFASSATLPASLGTGNWTIETWVYLNTLSPANYEVIANYGYEFGNQTYQSWLLYINTDNTLHFAYQTGSSNIDTSFGVPSISATTWAHIAIVRNGTTITAYINGTAMATTINIGTSNIIYRAAPSQFTIGWSGTDSFFNGYMDDFRISKFARYTANFTPPASALPTF